MEKNFDIVQSFSDALDQARGPERRRYPLERARSWISPSPARRGAVGILGAGALVGALGFLVFKNKSGIARTGSRITRQVADLAENTTRKAIDRIAS